MAGVLWGATLIVHPREVPLFIRHANIAGVLAIVVVVMDEVTSSMAMVDMKTVVLDVMALDVVASAEAQEDYRINNNIKFKTSRIMKKLLMISVMLLVGALSVSAQTYCYKNLYKVNKNGVREKTSGMIRYVTFTNNKSTCYESDENGIAQTYTLACHYIRSENGILVYKGEQKGVNMGGGLVAGGWSQDYLFSSDYSRLNIIQHSSFSDGSTWVYERITSPDKQNTPTQLY